MSAKLDRIGADLEKARRKRAEWDAKVKDLERRYREEENSEIHEMVHAANLNPEQLSELLRMFAADMASKPDTLNTMNEEEVAEFTKPVEETKTEVVETVPEITEPTPEENPKSTNMLPAILTLIVIACGGGFFVFKKVQEKKKAQ